jgi:hypothetical protein
MRLPPRARSALAWSLWVATVAGSVIGLLSIIAWTRPLTLAVVLRGTADTIVLPVGFATIGLVLALRRPGNPIGWLFAASGLAWCLMACGTPWVLHLAGEHRPLPPAAQFMAVWAEVGWAPATALGVTLPALLLPDGRLRSPRWRVVVVATVTVEAFAARLRHHVDLDTLSAELLAVVDHTMQPTEASLWPRPPAAPLDGERTGVRQQA